MASPLDANTKPLFIASSSDGDDGRRRRRNSSTAPWYGSSAPSVQRRATTGRPRRAVVDATDESLSWRCGRACLPFRTSSDVIHFSTSSSWSVIAVSHFML